MMEEVVVYPEGACVVVAPGGVAKSEGQKVEKELGAERKCAVRRAL